MACVDRDNGDISFPIAFAVTLGLQLTMSSHTVTHFPTILPPVNLEIHDITMKPADFPTILPEVVSPVNFDFPTILPSVASPVASQILPSVASPVNFEDTTVVIIDTVGCSPCKLFRCILHK